MNTQHSIDQRSPSHHISLGSAVAEAPFVAPTSFQHITLNTGHSCSQPRSAVAVQVAETLAQVIGQAFVNDGWTDLMRFGEPCPLHLTGSSSTLVAELYLPNKDLVTARPAVRIGISAQRSAGPDVWRYLCESAPRIGSSVPRASPVEPWIGAVLGDFFSVACADTKGLMAYAAMMKWAGDFERCLAWGFVTWLESKSQRK